MLCRTWNFLASSNLILLFLLTSLAPTLLPAPAAGATDQPAATAGGQPATAKTQPTRRRKRIAVVNFEIPPSLYSGWGNQGRDAADRLSAVLSDMMITALVKSGTFDVIERTELEKILKEHKLNAEGLLDPATAPKAGKILGVDMILGGKLTEFGMKTKGTSGLGAVLGGGIGIDYKKSTARAVIDARMIDTTTAKILLAEQGMGENSESSVGFAGSDFSHFLVAVKFDSSEWTESRIGRATRTAVDQVVEKITKVFPVEANVLAALPDGSLIVDLGLFNGIKVDDQFDLLRVSPIKDEETGEVIYEDRKALGLIKVIEVQENRCKCAVVGTLAGGEIAKKGDLAILKKAPPKPPKGK
ncbi:MAG: CsgG/HfaB family protein [Armatimonadota bacterium]